MEGEVELVERFETELGGAGLSGGPVLPTLCGVGILELLKHHLREGYGGARGSVDGNNSVFYTSGMRRLRSLRCLS